MQKGETRRAWVLYGRTASSTASYISCSKKTGWQTNHLSLQALRLTNEEITAFSGHKQGKFLRYYHHSRWYSIKVFIAHILVLLSLNSSFNWNATANLTNRENFCEKFRRKIWVERIFARKVGPNYWWRRTTARNFPLTKTMGSGKIHGIFFELSRWARLRHFSSKSPEIREFRRITLSLLLHNTVTLIGYYTHYVNSSPLNWKQYRFISEETKQKSTNIAYELKVEWEHLSRTFLR